MMNLIGTLAAILSNPNSVYDESNSILYTRVNKRMRLFAELQGNVRLISNMRLIAKGKIDHTSKTAMPSLVARVLDSK